jgi:hypothetical protein
MFSCASLVRSRLARARIEVVGFFAALAVLSLTLVALPSSPASATDTPSWWNGTCDVNNHPGSYALAASYNGVQACGPGKDQGGADREVHFYKGAWGEYEWECVELVMRYMYLIYDISPYSANGNTVVSNYKGKVLTNVSNNGASLPTPGDIVSENNGTTDGHTAVVTNVSVSGGNGTVTVMQQNITNNGWGYIPVKANKLSDGVTGWLHNPKYSSSGGGGVGTATYLGTDSLGPNASMSPGQYIMSADNRFVLIFQNDGNLVLYGPGYAVLWASNTAGSGANNLIMQSDGNLVLYKPGGVAWSSGKAGAGASTLVMQDDGNAVTYNSGGGATWASDTGGWAPGPSYAGSDQLGTGGTLLPNTYLRSSDHRFVLVLQGDGNLVLYGPAWHTMWAANKAGNSPTELILGDDGNLVLYGSSGAYWSSNTPGSGANQFIVQNDGNAVLYGPAGAPWATNTAGKT